jgi:hypothetical protein
MDFLTLAAIVLCCYLFYKWATINNTYFVAKGIKYVKPTFLVGTNASMVTQKHTLPEMLTCWYNAFPAEK